MDGYIKIHRKIFDNPYYFKYKFDEMRAWIDLLLLAREKDDHIIKRGIRVDIKRGQIAEGIDMLSYRWRWSYNKTKRFIIELEMNRQIDRQINNVTTLISIVNYDLYQNIGRQIEQTNEQANEHTKKAPKTRPSSYTLSTQLLFDDHQTIKPIDQAVIWPTFEDFWHEYDKKVGRPKAEPKWNRLTQVEKEKIMQFIPLYKNSRPDKQFTKSPESFFNNKTWNDEIITNNGTDNKQQQALTNFLKI